jgi:adenylate cyclase
MADTRKTCLCALAAAQEAEVNIDAIDTFTNTHGVRFGLALHIGEVLYGNIGSGNRLDFTCIGPAVNLSFPKISSGLDSHCKVESSHH